MPLVTEQTIFDDLYPVNGGRPSPVRPHTDVPLATSARLPERPVLRSPLPDVLARRRSPKRFGGPVPLELLAFVCDAGIAAERAQFPRSVHGDFGHGVAVAAYDVAGLPAGLYRFVPGGEFTPTRPFDRMDLLRTVYAPAPVLLFAHGDLHRARTVSPGRGYQRLLVRAGALGHGCLLAAFSAGLCARPFGRSSGEISVRLREDGDEGHPHHLFTVALGLPVAPEADDAARSRKALERE
jgi:hypothetical protein